METKEEQEKKQGTAKSIPTTIKPSVSQPDVRLPTHPKLIAFNSGPIVKKRSNSRMFREESSPSLRPTLSNKPVVAAAAIATSVSALKDPAAEASRELTMSLLKIRQVLVKNKKSVSTLADSEKLISKANQLKNKMRVDGLQADPIQSMARNFPILKRV